MGTSTAGTVLLGVALGAGGVSLQAAAQKRHKQTGFYLVLAESSAAQTLPLPTSEQQILGYDYRFLRTEEREAVKYLRLARRPDVALLLRRPPQRQIGEGGRTELLLEVTEDAAAALARLTERHLGQQVAFVIDGEVVSTHKIRSVISDGKFRMSRCTDNACEYIYGRLTNR